MLLTSRSSFDCFHYGVKIFNTRIVHSFDENRIDCFGQVALSLESIGKVATNSVDVLSSSEQKSHVNPVKFSQNVRQSNKHSSCCAGEWKGCWIFWSVVEVSWSCGTPKKDRNVFVSRKCGGNESC